MGSSSEDISKHKHDESAKVLLASGSESGNTMEMMNALRDLSLKFDKHINETETKLQEYDQTLLTLSSQSNTRGGGSFYSNRKNPSYNFRRGRRGRNFSNSTGRNEPRSNDLKIECFKCGGFNHLAKHCLAPNSGNR